MAEFQATKLRILHHFQSNSLKFELEGKKNKTPGYLRDILRPPTWLKMPFRRMKMFFFQILCFFIILSNFSNFRFFLIFAKKTSKIRWKDIFKKKCDLSDSRKILPHVAILKNFEAFFEKNLSISPKNPSFEHFENSYYSSRILRQICFSLVKKISRSQM